MLPLEIMIVRFPCKWNPGQFHFSHFSPKPGNTTRANETTRFCVFGEAKQKYKGVTFINVL